MQGACGSKVKIGLYFQDTLVSLMTFGGYRKNMGLSKKENEWELIRFCNLGGYKVMGGGSKLLNHFIKKYSPNKIISYCDRRWSNGSFYQKIGFNLEREKIGRAHV